MKIRLQLKVPNRLDPATPGLQGKWFIHYAGVGGGGGGGILLLNVNLEQFWILNQVVY